MVSSCSNPCPWKYDVFISFSGADIRDGFLSHLFEAFCKNKIDAFKDENLERGEMIEPALLKTIEESYISIVIFSENYAYSSWCLDELVKIMDCKKEIGQIVLPVFYRIDPSDVQELTGSYGNALVKHAEQFQDKVESWRLALTKTAVSSGFVSQNLKPESKLIDEIVKHVLERLHKAFSSDLHDDGLVGMESRLEDVGRLLDLEATDVRFIGIWGMGGLGKTTLATKVFDRFSSHFQVQCFIANVREQLERCTIAELQQQILSKSLGKEHLDVGMPIMSSSSIRKWIMRKKVLVVLDDVWDFDVVEFLVGKQSIYSPGSRIVITTRYKQILNNIGAEIYQVKELNDSESLKLFSSHAFKQNSVPEKFKEVARKAAEYAGGNPLALRVLGSSLYGKKVAEWKDQLKRLENIPDKKIEEILRISYDKLDDNEKEIFLDIACFFYSEDKEYLESVLESCFGRYARIGITALLDKCLINVSDMKLKMHDLLRQMGRDIVHKECVKNPGNRSRLWNPEDIYRVLSKDMGTISVESISLDITRIRSLKLSPAAFFKMTNLRFLKFYRPYFNEDFPLQHDKIQDNSHLYRAGLNYLPDELRYLHWFNYPFKSLPFNFCLDKLVQLHLIHSNLQKLCGDDQHFENLKVLDLSYSINLIIVPDLSQLKKLEVLRLRGCTSLVEIRSSVQNHNKLSHLDLRNCKNLCTLPKFIEFKNLDFLSLEGCSMLTEFPKAPRNLKRLNISRTAILEVPPSIVHHPFLTELQLGSCTWLESLPSSMVKLKCLEKLNLKGCSNLRELPEVPCNLKYLYLDKTAIQQVPSSIGHCSSLIHWDLTYCRRLESLPSSIGDLKCLQQLDLEGCSKLKSLPDAFCNLKALASFNIEDCRNLKELPENLGNLESLKRFCASGSGLEMLPLSINLLGRVDSLNYNECGKLILPPITGLVGLSYLDLKDCGMTEISISTGSLVSLKSLDLSGNLLEELSTSIGSLVSLTKLNLRGNLLKKLPTSIGSLVSLTTLDVSGNLLEELPTSIGSLVSLTTLDVSGNLLEELPTSIGSLASLTKLHLSRNLLQKLPTSIGSLTSLTELHLSGNLLQKLPTSIGSLISLTKLNLAGNLFEMLPTSIERLSRLELLNLEDCKKLKCLSNLPSPLNHLNVTNCGSLESILATKGNSNGFPWIIDAFNCMNLGVNTRRNITEAILLGIKSFCWRINYESPSIRAYYEKWAFTSSCTLGIPGDEVPQGMKHRNNNGSFLQCPLRQDPIDLMVLNFCAVVACNDRSSCDITRVECEYNLESECGQLLHYHFVFWVRESESNWSGEHVLMWQGGLRVSSNYIWKKASFKFNARDEEGFIAAVIKCGVDIFYGDDDMDSPSFKFKDANQKFPSYCCSLMSGSTKEEAKPKCPRCDNISYLKKAKEERRKELNYGF